MSPARRRGRPLGLWPVWSLVPFGWVTFIGFMIAARAPRVEELARTDPVLALEMGLGRIDVDHAGVDAVARIPGADREVAERIARARDELNGFASAAELATTLDLPPHLFDDLDRHAVYLPRD